MEFNIKSIGFSPSEALNKNIENKLTRAFSRYSYIKEAGIFLKTQSNEKDKRCVMEIRVPLPHGELFAESREETMRNALDRNMDKLKRQLERYKEKAYANP